AGRPAGRRPGPAAGGQADLHGRADARAGPESAGGAPEADDASGCGPDAARHAGDIQAESARNAARGRPESAGGAPDGARHVAPHAGRAAADAAREADGAPGRDAGAARYAGCDAQTESAGPAAHTRRHATEAVLAGAASSSA